MTEMAPGAAFATAGFLGLTALGLWWRARRSTARMVRAAGRITHFISEVSERDESDVVYLPHIEFELPTGTHVTFQSRSTRSNQAMQGSTVTVLYDPKSPASSAEIEGRPAWAKTWSPVLVAAGLSLFVFVLGLLAWFGL